MQRAGRNLQRETESGGVQGVPWQDTGAGERGCTCTDGGAIFRQGLRGGEGGIHSGRRRHCTPSMVPHRQKQEETEYPCKERNPSMTGALPRAEDLGQSRHAASCLRIRWHAVFIRLRPQRCECYQSGINYASQKGDR